MAAIDELIAGLPPRKPRNNRTRNRLNTVVRDEELELVERAAEARGISLAAFTRFAADAFACYVLGVDYYEFMHDLKVRPVRSYTQVPVEDESGKIVLKQLGVQDGRNGKGGGPWKITGLE
jgi:hypothetical protein